MEQNSILSGVQGKDTTIPALLPNVVCAENTTNRLVVIERVRRDGFLECRDMFSKAELIIHRTNLIPMATIPAKFKQHQFMQVAEHLATALNAFPEAIRIDPRPLAVETLMRKIREAITAKQMYHWTYHRLNEKLWEEHSHDLTVAMDSTGAFPTILIGSRQTVRNKKTAVICGVTKLEASWIELCKPTENELEAVCQLLHFRRMSPPQTFAVRDLTPEQIESIEQRYDIAVLATESDPKLFRLLA